MRAFYASEGVTLGPIPIGKSQNEVGDGLYDLEEAARLPLGRDDLGSLFAGPPDKLVPLYNKHLALHGAYCRGK